MQIKKLMKTSINLIYNSKSRNKLEKPISVFKRMIKIGSKEFVEKFYFAKIINILEKLNENVRMFILIL